MCCIYHVHTSHHHIPELSARLATDSGRNLRRAILMLEACRAAHPQLAPDTKIQHADWHQFIDYVGKIVCEEQSPARLQVVRGKLYELLSNCVPPEIIIKVRGNTHEHHTAHRIMCAACTHVMTGHHQFCPVNMRTSCACSHQTLTDSLLKRVDDNIKHEIVQLAADYVSGCVLCCAMCRAMCMCMCDVASLISCCMLCIHRNIVCNKVRNPSFIWKHSWRNLWPCINDGYVQASIHQLLCHVMSCPAMRCQLHAHGFVPACVLLRLCSGGRNIHDVNRCIARRIPFQQRSRVEVAIHRQCIMHRACKQAQACSMHKAHANASVASSFQHLTCECRARVISLCRLCPRSSMGLGSLCT